MTAINKTRMILRMDLPLELLVKNEENPNKMSSREFDLLVDNMQQRGWTDPAVVCPVDFEGTVAVIEEVGKDPVDLAAAFLDNGLKFRIVGGHHRFDAAAYLEFVTGPCSVIIDSAFDEDQERFQLVRHNMIKGSLDPESFFSMYSKLSGKYADDILQESFGFAEEAEFQKLIKQTISVLPTDTMKKKFQEAAAEIKTIDGLSKLLNEMFTKYGDTLPYGYMVVDYGSQRSVWIRVQSKTMDALDVLGELCIENKRTMDDILGSVVQSIAKGEDPGSMKSIIEKTPEVELPSDMPVLPTKENVEKISAI